MNTPTPSEEQWLPVRGIEHSYSVSSDGRIRRETTRTCGKSGSILVGAVAANGYLRMTMMYPKKQRCVLAHRLVAEAFIPNPNNFPQVNHINGDKLDNRATNLEWCTPSQNKRHSIEILGRRPAFGAAHYRAILNETQVRVIRACERLSVSHGWQASLARLWGVSHCCVGDVARGVNWKTKAGATA